MKTVGVKPPISTNLVVGNSVKSATSKQIGKQKQQVRVNAGYNHFILEVGSLKEDEVTEDIEADHTLDCIGLYCPEPIFRIRNAINEIAVGETLGVLADDPAAEEDILRWAKRSGNEILKMKKEGTRVYFLIKKTK